MAEPDTQTAAPAAAPGGHLEPVQAAGAVLWRDTDRGREVALVHRPGRDDWTLPKGKPRSGEHLLAAAVREVREETGVHPVLGRRLPSQRYLRNGWPKQVEWWAATAASDSSRFTPDDEVDAVEWLPVAEARDRLTHDHDVRVLDDFQAGPARTVPLVLLRHAAAGDKVAWRGPDLLRPLDETGRAEALELAGVLGAFGPLRVVSSAAARCTETVTPYAVAHAVHIRTENAFTLGARHAAGDPYDSGAAREAFRELLEQRRPTLVCTHGELVADLMREAFERSGAPVPQQLSLVKGAFWVFHLDARDGSLAAAERHGRA